jgi:CO/xanthine dehydrogenase Mo-binding subunit
MHKLQLVAEISIAGVVSVMANAVHDAAGVWMQELPCTPERVRPVLNKLN